jgi:hypothetical protein
MTETGSVLVERDGPVTIVSINRPPPAVVEMPRPEGSRT